MIKHDPYIRRCELHRVIDGDTVVLQIDMGFHCLTLQKVRLLGIDTPEIRGEERTKGLAAKEFVENWFALHLVNGTKVFVSTEKSDSFGRWLGEIYAEGQAVSLNSQLMAKGHAVPYKRRR